MAGVLIAMRVAVLRHSLRGQKAAWTATCTIIGLALAVGTVLAGFGLIGPAAGTGTLLASLWGMWVLGWALAPLISGGGEVLPPENFAVLPIRRGALAAGLLASSFAGFGPAVTLVAWLSLLPYAVTVGPASLLVAVPAIALQLVFVVLLARFVNAVAGAALRTHAGAAVVAIVWAGSTALMAQGWALVAALAKTWGPAGPAALDTATGWLPFGWPITAVEAAGRGDWAQALGVLAALAALIAVMLLLWSRMLTRRLTSRPASPRPRRVGGGGIASLFGSGPVGAVAAKELRAWSRDLLRVNRWWFALVYGLVFCLLPVLVGWWGMAPYAGLATLLMAAGLSANAYGGDGTALWLTLMTPGASRVDVRGRQLAWLTVFVPLVLVLTVGLTILSGDTAAWPWVLGLMPGALGGAAGLVSAASVFMLVPLTDPHKRGANPLSLGANEGSASGLVYLLLIGVPLTCAPSLALLWAGTSTGSPWLSWLGVPAGLATGALCVWLGGRLAHRRLDTHGPELLQQMRTGDTQQATLVKAPDGSRQALPAFKLSDLPRSQAVTVGICFGLGWLPLFPQGLVALAFLLFGQRDKSWFLATYLGDFGIPFAALMITLGACMYGTALSITRRFQRRRAAEEAEAARAAEAAL